jgi:hypothetical protein
MRVCNGEDENHNAEVPPDGDHVGRAEPLVDLHAVVEVQDVNALRQQVRDTMTSMRMSELKSKIAHPTNILPNGIISSYPD